VFVRLDWKSLSMTNTSLLRKPVINGLNFFITLGPVRTRTSTVLISLESAFGEIRGKLASFGWGKNLLLFNKSICLYGSLNKVGSLYFTFNKTMKNLFLMPFRQLDISSTWHFVNLTFCQLDISSTWHFVIWLKSFFCVWG
jgi:hypothetical protein